MPGPQTMRLIDPDGITRDVPIDAAAGLLQDSRWRVPTDEDTAARLSQQAKEETYGGVGGAVKAGLAGAARGVTLGLSDVAARALGGEQAAIDLEGLRSENPSISTATEVGGALAPAIVSGGAGYLAGRAAAAGAELGAGARALAGAARIGEALPAGVASRAGAAVGGLIPEAGAVGKIGGAAIGGAAEGALFGAGQGVSELALSQDPLTVEHIASSLSSNALYGAALGAPIGGLGKAAELGLRRAKGAIDSALEKRALGKAQTPIEAIESGDLQHIDKRILDTAEKAEIERISAEQEPARKAFTDEIDTWRRSNRDEHELREIAKASTDPDLREAGGAFDRANLELRKALDNKIKFTKDPIKSLEAVQRQAQALDEMKAAALEHQRRWQQEVAEAPAQIRAALDEVDALGAPRPTEVPDYAALKSQIDSAGQDYVEQTVSARALAEHGYYEPPGGGVDKVKTAKARRAIEEGQQEAIKLNVTPSGKVIVDDGRHRLAAAIKADKPIRVQWSTAYEEGAGADMVLRSRAPGGGADLLKARKALAGKLGLRDEIGPFTEAGKEAAAERVLKSRMADHWHGDGGATLGGLKEPSIVRRLSKIDGMIAANQRLQAQLEALAKPPTSELLTKIADARAVLEGPKPAPSGLGAVVSAVAPFAGPAGAAAAAGGRVISSFKKLAGAVGERVGKAASTFAGAAIPATKYAVPLATRTLATVRYGEDDKGKRPPAGGKTLPDLYEARTNEVRSQVHVAPDGSYQMRPEARAKMATKFDGIRPSDPVLADQLEELGARRLEYLARIMPRLPDYAAMSGITAPRISDMAMRSWARSANALEDPHAVLERATNGHVTLEDAAAIKAVYPELLGHFLSQVGTRERKGPLPFKQRFALSVLSGEPHDPALTPQVLSILQGSFTNDAGVPTTQAPTAMPAFGSVKRSIPDPTPSQRRAQGQTEA